MHPNKTKQFPPPRSPPPKVHLLGYFCRRPPFPPSFFNGPFLFQSAIKVLFFLRPLLFFPHGKNSWTFFRNCSPILPFYPPLGRLRRSILGESVSFRGLVDAPGSPSPSQRFEQRRSFFSSFAAIPFFPMEAFQCKDARGLFLLRTLAASLPYSFPPLNCAGSSYLRRMWFVEISPQGVPL